MFCKEAFKRTSIIALIYIFFASNLSFAAVPEGSKGGAVEKEVQNIFQKKIKTTEKPSPHLEENIQVKQEEAAVKSKLETEKVLVKDFAFKGNTVISSDVFLKLLKNFLNKELNMEEINKAISIVADVYRKKGFILVTVYFPEQEIKDGVLTINIIEGKLNNVFVKGNKKYKEDFIKSHFIATQNGVLNYNNVMRSLHLLNEYPGLKVKAIMEQGKVPETADIYLEVDETSPVSVSVEHNNFGTKYVTKNREIARVKVGNVGVPGSELSVKSAVGNPVNSLVFNKVDYSFPINEQNTKVGASYIRSDFNGKKSIIGFDTKGKTNVYSVYLTQPLVRDYKTSSDFMATFDAAQIKYYQSGLISSNDELRVFRFDYILDALDSWSGRNYVDAKLSLGVDGIVDASKKDSPYRSRVGAGSDFVKANIDYQRLQRLPFSMSLYLKFSGQVADSSLPVYEQMYIGGADSVRGYAQAEYLGDYGYSSTVEIRTPIPGLSEQKVPFLKNKQWREFLQFAVFYDFGGAYLNNVQAGENKDEFISGVGCGLRFNFPYDIFVSFDYATAVGQAPANSANHAYYLQVTKKIM